MVATLAIVVGFQAVATLAIAVGLVVYGSRWIERLAATYTKAIDLAVERLVDALESAEDRASIEREKLTDRIQNPLAPHVQAMTDANPRHVPLHTEPQFEDLGEIHETDIDPNFDPDLMIAYSRNGDS